ncbi:MAG TPA: hypothetical protein VGO84_14405, partial [Burkholderiales bacterium]|nr:hypothetical protein [Burkholderiales bacterium]
QARTDHQVAIFKGTVSIVLPNMFLYGKSNDLFGDCEVVIVTVPRSEGAWLTGVVCGISSGKEANFPSASRAVMHYIGDNAFSGAPDYLPLNKSKLPSEYRKFLAAQPEADHPILSSRPRD